METNDKGLSVSLFGNWTNSCVTNSIYVKISSFFFFCFISWLYMMEFASCVKKERSCLSQVIFISSVRAQSVMQQKQSQLINKLCIRFVSLLMGNVYCVGDQFSDFQIDHTSYKHANTCFTLQGPAHAVRKQPKVVSHFLFTCQLCQLKLTGKLLRNGYINSFFPRKVAFAACRGLDQVILSFNWEVERMDLTQVMKVLLAATFCADIVHGRCKCGTLDALPMS